MRRLIVPLVGAALSAAALLGFATQVSATPPPNTNEVAYWCGSSDLGVKYDPVSTPFVVPAPPAGTVWTLLVLKAGSDVSVETGENETFTDPVVGQSYTHSSGKDLSHAILCYGIATTTVPTTAAATTLPSTTQFSVPTTLATTTTAATTTTGATTTAAATTTQGTTTTTGQTTTTAATTTVPQTTTTAGSCAPLCAGQFGTTTTVPATTTTVPATTTTAPAATTTVPAVTTTVGPAPEAVVTTTPAELPHTGANYGAEIAGAFMLIFLGWAAVGVRLR